MTNTLLTLHDPEAAQRYYGEGLWRDDTLYTLLAGHAAGRPEAERSTPHDTLFMP